MCLALALTGKEKRQRKVTIRGEAMPDFIFSLGDQVACLNTEHTVSNFILKVKGLLV